MKDWFMSKVTSSHSWLLVVLSLMTDHASLVNIRATWLCRPWNHFPFDRTIEVGVPRTVKQAAFPVVGTTADVGCGKARPCCK